VQAVKRQVHGNPLYSLGLDVACPATWASTVPAGISVPGLGELRIVVSASTRGLGRGVAEVLLHSGARVVINGSRRETVARAVEELRKAYGENRVHGVVADLTSPEETSRLVHEAAGVLGGLDGGVFVPPPPPPGGFSDVGLGEWRRWSEALTLSPVWFARAMISYLEPRADSAGGLVFVTSIAVKEPIPDIALSNTFRISIHGLVKTLAYELGPRGIRVNAVLPGYFLTDRVKTLAEKRSRETGRPAAEVIADMGREVPLGRIGDPRELGGVVAFLLSPLASYVHGASIPVDGGRLRSVF